MDFLLRWLLHAAQRNLRYFKWEECFCGVCFWFYWKSYTFPSFIYHKIQTQSSCKLYIESNGDDGKFREMFSFFFACTQKLCKVNECCCYYNYRCLETGILLDAIFWKLNSSNFLQSYFIYVERLRPLIFVVCCWINNNDDNNGNKIMTNLHCD